ncbi:MAG TPA: LysR substrate-binding domain-containing protein [Polyangiaceae bacterium]|nr:LysR substrate-binding domain-containing protein [Polyangiaceae bacterium]
MDLRHLRYFVAVAEERHFGRAAERLHMAQPPLSRQIQALEAELGYPLFARNRRRVELTEAGAVLLDRSRQVFAAVERAVRDAERANAGKSGRIAVGYLSSLAYTGLTALLRAFRAEFPDVELVLREMAPAAQLEALKEGILDIGFVRGPVEDASLTAEHIRKERLLVAVAADHPFASRARIPLEQLASEPFVMFPRARAATFFDQLMAICRNAGFTPKIVQEAPQLDIVSLVAAGFGVALMPESIREVNRPDIALVPLVGSPSIELLVAWRAGNGSSVLQTFLGVTRRVLGASQAASPGGGRSARR